MAMTTEDNVLEDEPMAMAEEESDGRSDGSGMSDSIAVASLHNGGPKQQRRESRHQHTRQSELVISEDELADPVPTSLPHSWSRPQQIVHTVAVSPVKDRDAYEYFPDELRVKRIVRKVGSQGLGEPVQYVVQFEGGDTDTVPFDRLILLPRGHAALDLYEQDDDFSHVTYARKEGRAVSNRRGRRSTIRPTHNMATQRLSFKRSGPPGFVSSSNLKFSSSEDDESNGFQTASHRRRASSRLTRSKVQSPHRDQEDYSSDNDDSEAEPYSRRSTRRRRRTSAEKSAEDMGSDTVAPSKRRPFKASKQKPTRRLRSRNIDSSLSESDSGSLQPVEGTRRSFRTGRTTKSMRERAIDDIYASDDGGDGVTPLAKYVGAKEVFRELPRTNDFRQVHCQYCDTCRQFGDNALRGKLVFCQGCSLSYHKGCLGPRNQREHLVTKVAEDDFVLQCRRCINMAKKKDPHAPRLDICFECKDAGPACAPFRARKTARQEEKEREENEGEDPITQVDPILVNNADNVLYRCLQCFRCFHYAHLPPLDENTADAANEGDYIDQRKREYCKEWMCKDCQDMPSKVAGLVAWRPVDIDRYIPGHSAEMVDEDEKEYLVKWDKLSYFRATWAPGPWVWGVTSPHMRKAFFKQDNVNKMPTLDAADAIPEEYLRVDIVFDVEYSSIVDVQNEEVDKARVKEVTKALVKFKGLGYEDATWETVPTPEDGERWTDFSIAYNNYVMGKYVTAPKQGALREQIAKVRSLDFKKKLLQRKQPAKLTGGELMEYQLEGINWLLYKWHQGQNGILADEMGLGKTVQIIGLLAALVQEHRCFPFLIVVPNSTCPNWRREIQKWAPSIRAVTYYGTSKARQMAYEYELFPKGPKNLKCHVVITSYETAIEESARRFFRSVTWAGLVVDEGQRLKNDKNQLYEALNGMNTFFKVLLTGTPLQNNARELFNLLQFLDPAISAKDLEIEYANLTKENVPQLHDLLRPFFLRRTKAQVLTFLPPMAQVIVPVTMTVVQKKLYKSILAKNPDLIKAIFGRQNSLKQSERQGLNNILMQLRKCLCHPFVYSRAIEEKSSSAAISHRNLVEASSKLQLLEIMLPKLQERGHRVLIFSQFLDMLDVMEDFLDGLQLRYERLDGTVSSLKKQKRIDAFNAPNSELFAFLLSTRAGGVGINLASADTVIIMDPDFNPHQDIQALSRAHRIGQKKKVLVFQLMTRDSAEEKIVQIGRKKMALDQVLIEQMDAEDDAGQSLESILRHGAAALFEDNAENEIRYDSSSVDKLLGRSQAENTKTGDDTSAESQFSFARVWANDQGALEEDLKDTDTESKAPDPTIWERILKEREMQAAKEAALRQEVLGRGKRKRQTVDYNQTVEGFDISPIKRRGKDQSSSDTDFRDKGPDESEDEAMAEEGAAELATEVQSLDVRKKQSNVTEVPPEAPKEAGKRGRKRKSAVLNDTSDNLQGSVRRTTGNGPSAQGTPQPGQIPQLDGPNVLLPQPGTIARCIACEQVHPVGACPLKLMGVQKCGLCGLAHFGANRNGVIRTCPHLSSETQVRAMMEALRQSTESSQDVALAMHYLRGVKGNLVLKKKRQAEKLAAQAGAQQAPTTAVAAYPEGRVNSVYFDGQGTA